MNLALALIALTQAILTTSALRSGEVASVVEHALGDKPRPKPDASGNSKMHLLTLSSKELAELLPGASLKSQSSSSRPAFVFSENFGSSGEWYSVRQMRAVREYHGRWRILNDQVCISRQDRAGEVCRKVLKLEGSSAFFIEDLDDRDGGPVEVSLNKGEVK